VSNKVLVERIHLYVEDCDAIYKRAMDAATTSIIEPADQFYGDRTALYVKLICTTY
jgi:PhnB protein